MTENIPTQLFDNGHKGVLNSPTYINNFRKVYGSDYPDVGQYGYLTKKELERMAKRFDADCNLVDLACGTGGPGSWIAHKVGATLIGIDISPEAIKNAQRYSTKQITFIEGDISNTSFPDNNFDGATCIDGFIFTPDKPTAFREANRIIKKGSYLVFTSWDRETSPPLYPPPIRDHRPMLKDAGFEIVTYDVNTKDEDKRRELYLLNIESADALMEEMGEESANVILGEARLSTGEADGIDHTKNSKRIFVEVLKM